MRIPQEIKALIAFDCPAHPVTLNEDGSPQVTPAVRFWHSRGYAIVSEPKLMPDQTTVYDL
jgi:hypothetical protein